MTEGSKNMISQRNVTDYAFLENYIGQILMISIFTLIVFQF
jgi:hypothetical protein